MKTSLILSLCFFPLTVFSKTAVLSEKIIEKDTPTESELRIKREQIQAKTLGTTFTPPAPSSAVVGSDPQDFVKSSDILCFGDAMILIPKHSVIVTPKNLAARLSATPEARLVTWSAFYPANRSWLTTVELSPEQAAGEVPIPTEMIDSLAKIGKLVVTTFKGNPISVNPSTVAVTPNPTKPTSQP